MKVGDLVRVKNPTYLVTGDNEEQARALYPWKFEVGVVIDARPYGKSFDGKEVYVCWPSSPLRTILVRELEVIG